MKFTIRDLLYLTVIAALVLGWWINTSALRAEISRLLVDLENYNSLISMEADLIRHRNEDLDWKVEFLIGLLRKERKEIDFGEPGRSTVIITETLPDGSKKRTGGTYSR